MNIHFFRTMITRTYSRQGSKMQFLVRKMSISMISSRRVRVLCSLDDTSNVTKRCTICLSLRWQPTLPDRDIVAQTAATGAAKIEGFFFGWPENRKNHMGNEVSQQNSLYLHTHRQSYYPGDQVRAIINPLPRIKFSGEAPCPLAFRLSIVSKSTNSHDLVWYQSKRWFLL